MHSSIFLISRVFSNDVEVQIGAFSTQAKAEDWLMNNCYGKEDYKIKEVRFYG